MPDDPPAQQKKDKWGGFVCPSCRSVFRVRASQAGKAVECPACRKPARLPEEGNREFTSWNQSQKPVAELKSEQLEKARHAPRRKRHRSRSREQHIEWEHGRKPGAGDSSPAPRLSLPWILALALAALSLLPLGGLFLEKNNQLNRRAASLATRDSPPASLPALPEPESLETGTDREAAARIETAATKEEKIRLNDLIAAATPSIRAFLEAPGLDDLLPLIRDRRRVEPLLRRFHASRPYSPPGFHEVLLKSGIFIDGDFTTFTVVTSDFSKKKIAVESQPDGSFLVDWESWTGYNPMPQARFKASRPSRPVLFRVRAKPATYYNYGFSDEGKWACYELTTTDDDTPLYGYLERGTAAHLEMIRLLHESNHSVPLRLFLASPSVRSSPDQTLIHSIAGKGWIVLPGEKE